MRVLDAKEKKRGDNYIVLAVLEPRACSEAYTDAQKKKRGTWMSFMQKGK